MKIIKIFAGLILLSALIYPVAAVDNTLNQSPKCLYRSYGVDSLLTGTEYAANTSEKVNAYTFDPDSGVIVGSEVRAMDVGTYSTAVICAIENPFETVAGGAKLYMAFAGGSFTKAIAYSDFWLQDLSQGEYVYPANTDGYHIVGYLANAPIASQLIPKFAISSGGVVYVTDKTMVKKIVENSLQLYYTLVPGDYNGINPQIIDIAFDSNSDLHVLIRAQCGGNNCLSRIILDESGTKLSTDLDIQDLLATIYLGFIIPDETNATTNYTYGFAVGGGGSYIYHNSSAGTTDVSGGLITPFTVTSGVYDNGLLYIADGDSAGVHRIRSIATDFVGFTGYTSFPRNPDGITGTFSWRDPAGVVTSYITPGSALAYSRTIDSTQTGYDNYDYYSAWSPNINAKLDQLNELTNLYGLGNPAVFNTNSNTLSGTKIYGFLLAKNKTSGAWSQLRYPVSLTIGPKLTGFDSITLDKAYYNLTGDTVTATFTYKDTYPWLYQWQVCSTKDCRDGNFMELNSLAPYPQTSSFVTTGMKQGNYFAVMMKHLPFLQNTIVAYQPFSIRPPIIGVSWDRDTYNLLPSGVTSSCLDSTPLTSYFTTISGYSGLQSGFFSCSSIPSAASANNSVMRASLFAKYSGTFYLNNSLGNIWNGTLNNGSGALIYVLTNTSATEQWTLVGFNTTGGETVYDYATVNPSDRNTYSINIDKSVAYNGDTLFITWTHPIWTIAGDEVTLMDADGITLASTNQAGFIFGLGSGQYYIDPGKQYSYGTWTAHIGGGGLLKSDGATDTVYVKNQGRPFTNVSTTPPPEGALGQSVGLVELLSSNLFWAIIFTVGAMVMVAFATSKR